MDKDYSPSTLPKITEVQIVDLRYVDVSVNIGDYMHVNDAPNITLNGTEAYHIATLWRQLPPGKMKRCHNPPFGLRFFTVDKTIVQGSVCWGCNNIFGDIDGEPFVYRFDGEKKPSRELLDELQRVTGIDVQELSPPNE